ncbi:MAG TPA: HEAT repeat domain-containing protein, partial [Kineosporiaceae bacterium]|nr:HEAT repeat domain-containing protein [Kineosporiaceae bacterium]
MTSAETTSRPRTPSDVVDILTRAALRGRFPQWANGMAVLAAFDAREWLLHDVLTRNSSAVLTGGRREQWDAANLDEPSGFVAVLASWHVDGYLRERAVEQLAARRGPVVASALAVRLLDHVPQVRAAAFRALRGQLSVEVTERVLAVVVAAQDRHNARDVLAALTEALREDGSFDAGLRQAMASPEVRLRRWACATAHAAGALTVGQLVDAVERDPDQLVRARCAGWLAEAAEPAQLRALLTSRAAQARVVALAKVPDADLDEAALRAGLADRSPSVRETARWRARRRGVDLAAWAREALSAGEMTARQRVGWLECLVAAGDRADVGLVERVLDAPERFVRAGAVAALASLGGREAVPRLRGLLLDPSPRVSASAARALTRVGAGPEQAEDAWRSPDPVHRRAAWRFARNCGAWDRVEASLRAAA